MAKNIKVFIQEEIFKPRLLQKGVLVVYDPVGKYRDLCLDLVGERFVVVDSTESSIESREIAMTTLQRLGKPGSSIDGLLVYVPKKQPNSDEEKQKDPFSVFGAIGAVFPDGDGDESKNICLKAKADHVTEIRRIFSENPNPPFAVIDAIGDGNGWPTLKALLKVESARDIIMALLAPSKDQLEELKSNEGWVPETRELLAKTLGLVLKTKSHNWSPIADELWRFVLFSEFVFDLPGECPSNLLDVPHAEPLAIQLVFDLCKRLRDSHSNRPTYIERAEDIEKDLGLQEACQDIEHFGNCYTFPFEERSAFALAVEALMNDGIDDLRKILINHASSVWIGRGESQAQWQLVQTAADLVCSCEDVNRQLLDNSNSLEALINFYTASAREVDRLQREFETASNDLPLRENYVDDMVSFVKNVYRKTSNRMHGFFIDHVERCGWPPLDKLSNCDVFDRLIAPRLQESGNRIAMLLIDSLRYELGLELEKQMVPEGCVQIYGACAMLPTVTAVGMASLLPGAGDNLKLTRKDNDFSVTLGERNLYQVNQRMAVLKERFGDRFAEMPLNDFVKGQSKPDPSVDLLVLRSNQIDESLESTEMALRLIQDSLKLIRVALNKLREQGFQEVFIATDHGFFLNTSTGPGDVCAKPPGNWVNVHERMLLGDGSSNGANVVASAIHFGIRGDFSQVAFPKSLVSYRAGQWYFHGGVSLQEAIVPVIHLQMHRDEEKFSLQPTINISYKKGSKKTTTRLPVIELTATAGGLFSSEETFEVLLEAHDRQSRIVGEAKMGGVVNSATRTVSLKPGQTLAVTMKMDLEFEGKFSVKALDPTTLKTYSKIDLETDYTV